MAAVSGTLAQFYGKSASRQDRIYEQSYSINFYALETTIQDRDKCLYLPLLVNFRHYRAFLSEDTAHSVVRCYGDDGFRHSSWAQLESSSFVDNALKKHTNFMTNIIQIHANIMPQMHKA